MRITLNQYERAKQAVAKLSKHQKTVEAWERALKSVGDTGDMKVVAFKIVDGKVTAECEKDNAQPALAKTG